MSTEHSIAEAFDFGGPILTINPYGRGLINNTYLVTLAGKSPRRVILQRINRQIFPKPQWIMGNLRVLLDHIHWRQSMADRPSRDLRVPTIYTSRNHQDFVFDSEGGFWRAMGFVDNTRSFDTIVNLSQAEEAGFALGRFHALVHDLEPSRLRDTLPDFHITPRYLARFIKSSQPVKSVDPELLWCFEFVAARRSLAGVLEQARHQGLLLMRPIHGDPKLNNVLFDTESDLAVSLIDLDTVKPGLIQYDIGDCLRSCCNRLGEAPSDPQAVRFDLDVCQALLKHYFDQTRGFLTRQDYAYCYDAIRLLPFELGLRFLTDHLEGNPYFKTSYRGQNLHRALTQFHLTVSIERSEQQIRRLIRASVKPS